MLSPQVFHAQIAYLSRRFGVIDPALAEDYYEFLQVIPDDRFVQICKEIFRDWDYNRLPPPKYFLDRSREIAAREALNAPRLPPSEPSMSQEEMSALAAKVREQLRAKRFGGSSNEQP